MLTKEGATINYIDEGQIEKKFQPASGSDLVRRSVPGSKLKTGSLSGEIADSSITTAKLASAAVTQSKFSYETVTLDFGAADTVKTGTITSGSIILGWYASAYTTPAASHLKLEISGTTLTGTLTAAPGGGNTLSITVRLLKS